MLNVQNLDFRYGKRQLLKDISFQVTPGEIVGLVAPNGTGKSTLLRNLTGLLKPNSGKFILGGQDASQNRQKFLQQLFFLEDNKRLFETFTAREHFMYVRDMWGSSISVTNVIRVLQMEDHADKRVSKMSLGMRQHVLLGMYLISDAQLLLFDEPLNGLDPTSIKRFTQIFSKLRQEGKSIVMSSHQLDNVREMTDRIFFLKDAMIQIYQTDSLDLDAKYEELYGTAEVEW